ncbi:stemmadenine O-acetyltransferase-like [Mercurialis annua]|uniref:stemmadenine O-acetyltransferase-like n=1 Tax=Mercurialis annua TaxID=3986 RepID=UPI00215EA3A8|nr:stemmadenine O-acetyltransferase-like [Mercurialis annua]
MEMQIISTTCITPSSPTPSYLRTYKISLLDQLMPSTCYPTILYYPFPQLQTQTDTIISKRSLLLKQSLSETLSRFYPLAGRIKDSLSVDCNDEGVCYVEARVKNISLSEFLDRPDLCSMGKLLPLFVSLPTETTGSFAIKIQETTFACGGLAIGFFVCHTVCDGIAFSSFLKDWAATAAFKSCEENTNVHDILRPYLDSSSVFLQNDAFSKEVRNTADLSRPFIKKMKLRTKRFVFDSSSIACLKDEAIRLGVENATRLEVVIAVLSKCLMRILNAKSGTDKPLAVILAVNLRRRAAPPFPECSFGNFVLQAEAVFKPEEAELSSLVHQLKESVGKFNAEFVKKLQGDGGYAELDKMLTSTSKTLSGSSQEGSEFVMFGSWCNFGMYEIDFGWGKPVWTSWVGSGHTSKIDSVNSIVLFDTGKDKGIEAWAYLDEQVLLLLEKDEDLLQYVCVDPNP